jgi:hypothetical protein
MHPESGDTPAARIAAALRPLSAELDADRISVPQAREVVPPPVLCPGPDSLVRFLPLLDKTGQPQAGPLRRLDGKSWRFVDLAAFEGADFAYAVCRSLLHRLPSERELEAAQSTEGRFHLLLAADFEARDSDGPGRLVGLASTKRLYRRLRALETLRLWPLATVVRIVLDARARRTAAKHRERIEARRKLMASLARQGH